VIYSYHHLTVCEVAEEVQISKTMWREILTENLDMHGVAAKFVVLLLSEYQKRNYVDVSNGLVDCVTADENFLKNIITVEETWAYGCDVGKNLVFTVGLKTVSHMQKSTESLVQCESDADCVF
jgi:hypothetical protein